MLWKLQQLPPGSTILIHYDKMDRSRDPWKAIATLHSPLATDDNLFAEGPNALEALYELLKKIKPEDVHE